MRFARVLSSSAFVGAALLAACGKTGGVSPVAGVYHLPGSAEATSLELRSDGTFSVRRESCVSAAVVSCGDWRAGAAGGARVVKPEALYWPTPDEFPSAVVRHLSLEAEGRELLVIGENEWAGTFTERWVPGRACAVCTERVSSAGATYVVSSARDCAEPFPACARM
jgi:hypothetical protein